MENKRRNKPRVDLLISLEGSLIFLEEKECEKCGKKFKNRKKNEKGG